MSRDSREGYAFLWIPALAFVLAVVLAGTEESTTASINSSANSNANSTANNSRSAAADTARTARRAALTFDDGPHEIWTPLLLDGLKERGVKATFFLMGEQIPGKEALVERMAAEGHLIGNHSYHHVQLTKENTEEAAQSFLKTSDLIWSITGTRPQYARPPYGAWSEALEERTNLTTVLWNVDSLDWRYQDRARTADKICLDVKDGDVILMHDIFKSSVEAALDVVDRLSRQGWEFVTVDELEVE